MQDHNPYAAPSANLGGKDSFGQEVGGVTKGVVDQLDRTKGWTRLCGIILIIMAALSMINLFTVGSAFDEISRKTNAALARPMIFFVIAMTAVTGVLYIVAGAKLLGFSSAIQRLLFSGSESDLDVALDRQRSFWVFAGVIVIVIIVLMVVGIAVGVAAAVSSMPR